MLKKIKTAEIEDTLEARKGVNPTETIQAEVNQNPEIGKDVTMYNVEYSQLTEAELARNDANFLHNEQIRLGILKGEKPREIVAPIIVKCNLAARLGGYPGNYTVWEYTV